MTTVLTIDERLREQTITHIIQMKRERDFEIHDLSVDTKNHYYFQEGAVLAIEAVEIDPGNGSDVPPQWWINVNAHDSCNLEEGVDFIVLYTVPDDKFCTLTLPEQYAFEEEP